MFSCEINCKLIVDWAARFAIVDFPLSVNFGSFVHG